MLKICKGPVNIYHRDGTGANCFARNKKQISSHGLVCKKKFLSHARGYKKSWCPMNIYFLKNTVIKWQKSQNEWQWDKVQSDSVRLISFHTQCHFVLLMHILAAYWNTPNNAVPPPPCLLWFRSGVLDSAQVSTVKMLKYERPCSKFGLLW